MHSQKVASDIENVAFSIKTSADFLKSVICVHYMVNTVSYIVKANNAPKLVASYHIKISNIAIVAFYLIDDRAYSKRILFQIASC